MTEPQQELCTDTPGACWPPPWTRWLVPGFAALLDVFAVADPPSKVGYAPNLTAVLAQRKANACTPGGQDCVDEWEWPDESGPALREHP